MRPSGSRIGLVAASTGRAEPSRRRKRKSNCWVSPARLAPTRSFAAGISPAKTNSGTARPTISSAA